MKRLYCDKRHYQVAADLCTAHNDRCYSYSCTHRTSAYHPKIWMSRSIWRDFSVIKDVTRWPQTSVQHIITDVIVTVVPTEHLHTTQNIWLSRSICRDFIVRKDITRRPQTSVQHIISTDAIVTVHDVTLRKHKEDIVIWELCLYRWNLKQACLEHCPIFISNWVVFIWLLTAYLSWHISVFSRKQVKYC